MRKPKINIESIKEIRFTCPVFPDHTFPKGALSSDLRSQACWYYYLLCQKQLENTGESTDNQFGILDIHPWQDRHFEQTAKSIAMIYQLESPSEFAKAWPEVEAEAKACKLPAPRSEYTRVAPHIILN